MSGVQAIPRIDGGEPNQMMVLPLNPISRLASAWQRPLALIFATNPQAKASLTTEQLQTLFGLTAAEARVAMGLAEGKTLDETAVERKVSINNHAHPVQTGLE